MRSTISRRRKSERVGWAADGFPAFVENMRVDHRGANVAVAQQLLDRADVVPVFQQMRGERMTQGVGRRVFGDARVPGGPRDGLLNDTFVQVMAMLDTGLTIGVM